MKKGITEILKTKLQILLPLIFFSLIAFVTIGISGNLEVHFIDGGQGDSIFIITPNQKTILIDAGFVCAENDKINPFNYIRNLKKKGRIRDLNIDAAFITHPDDDHYRGFNYLCKEPGGGQDFIVESIYYSVLRPKAYKKFWSLRELQVTLAGRVQLLSK